ncbi:ABC transporter substrate-binding protein [Microbacterium sp. cx-55]|uniref:ABC transporter substrate-binding protein n=1 Tax=unclassified Microbacterium TaxID=2609290 RepID=UPI001CBB709E|nr:MULTISPECIES: ABC transporter substrate-binding protein [unclassified Microbacterium]MBZ4487122.1 ABC transporter substrate-binding protein [Microbacterium sp. cx-55]MCC4908751.1 ABC transporter substrate-binding protein [Microbacterium sp. cx-59]UGB35158.1 ABC transporter substrate-binding protein [Microbacterium sp. cx-55]
MKKKALLLATGLAVTAVALAGCSGGSDPLDAGDDSSASSSSIVIGSADFPESQLLASIYSQALSAAGVDVTERFNVGSREITVPALLDGSLDLMPEYSGAFLSYLEPETTVVTRDEVLDELDAKLPEGLAMLEPADAEDKDVLAVTQATADEYGLANMSDLEPVAGQLALGAAAEWQTRQNGVLGLQSVYGLTFGEFVPLDAGGPLTVDALTNGQVQVANVFSTDPAISSRGFVVLDDDKGLFLAESVVPVINADKVTPEVSDALNAVSAILTTQDLIDLNTQIADGEDIAAVALGWLQDNDLV